MDRDHRVTAFDFIADISRASLLLDAETFGNVGCAVEAPILLQRLSAHMRASWPWPDQNIVGWASVCFERNRYIVPGSTASQA